MKKISKNGFTLLELLTVMTMGIILMSISTAAYYGIVRGSAVSGAVSSVRTVLSLARQHAISNQRRVYVVIEEDYGSGVLTKGRLCMAEYVGTHIGGVATPNTFRTSVTIGGVDDYIGARMFNITQGTSGEATGSGGEYIDIKVADGVTWGVGDRCAILVHDWVVLPEGIVFTNTPAEDLLFMQDGTTPMWSSLPDGNFVIEIAEKNGKGKGRLRVRNLGGQVDVLEGVVN